MFELDVDLPAELVPLSWLIGVWEGSGVMAYKVGDEVHEREFGQRIAFSHDGTPTCSTRAPRGCCPPRMPKPILRARNRIRVTCSRRSATGVSPAR
ncbi:hypothetical protein GCM10025869_18670 [Homoserinibacter gongjuensis]|uniref:THAP4-like heme-binding domain-containing protein n=1 Tax=Homoserinibacter gongjuensis TaxID=1162968 RepID=A0ABQ6JVD3_9MICO|nr:hypothetical protein GCM10025869_18670 [Homoserinibacter gongjuensis]